MVLATTPGCVEATRDDLGSLGLSNTERVVPGSGRTLVLAPAPDTATGHRIVTALRKKGHPVVLRPSSGPQLEAWVRHTRPVTVGDRLTITFAWSEHDLVDLPNVVVIDPAGGFGSAHHPATLLLLEELATRIAGGERVLDVGCGNGILGLSALRLGATHMSAADVEPGALESTRRNAALNGLDRLIDDRVDGIYDVIVANIGRDGLVEVGPDLAARVAPGGWLGVSGFSPPQCEVVAASLRPLVVVDMRMVGEWAALVLAPRAAEAE